MSLFCIGLKAVRQGVCTVGCALSATLRAPVSAVGGTRNSTARCFIRGVPPDPAPSASALRFVGDSNLGCRRPEEAVVRTGASLPGLLAGTMKRLRVGVSATCFVADRGCPFGPVPGTTVQPPGLAGDGLAQDCRFWVGVNPELMPAVVAVRFGTWECCRGGLAGDGLAPDCRFCFGVNPELMHAVVAVRFGTWACFGVAVLGNGDGNKLRQGSAQRNLAERVASWGTAPSPRCRLEPFELCFDFKRRLFVLKEHATRPDVHARW